MQEVCHRCQAELPERTRGVDAVLFCPHCSAPQIFLPEHLRAEGDGAAAETTGAAPPPRVKDVRRLDWQVVLQYAAWAGVVEAVLSVLGLGVPLISLVSPMWVLLGSSLVLATYMKRHPGGWIDAKAGLRVGLVTGLLLVAGKGVALSATGVAARFGMHSMGSFDADLGRKIADTDAQFTDMMKQQGQDQATQTRMVGYLNSPEMRAGSALFGAAGLGVAMLFFSTMGGAFAGTLHARARVMASRG